MIEFILLVVVGIVVLSIVQSVKRGDNSTASIVRNPTIVEKLHEEARKLEEKTSEWSKQQKFDLEHYSWFRHVKRTINSSLEYARESSRFDQKLEQNHDLRRHYMELLEQSSEHQIDGVPSVLNAEFKSDWLDSGPPPPPPSIEDPKEDRRRKEEYARQVSDHAKFLESVRDELRRTPGLQKHFLKSLDQVGLGAIGRDYFD